VRCARLNRFRVFTCDVTEKYVSTSVYKISMTITDSLVDVVYNFPKHFGKLWYLVDPRETTFEFLHEVPDYHQQVTAIHKQERYM